MAIIAHQIGKNWVIPANDHTYAHRQTLAQYGGRYSKATKSWTFYVSLPEQVRDLCTSIETASFETASNKQSIDDLIDAFMSQNNVDEVLTIQVSDIAPKAPIYIVDMDALPKWFSPHSWWDRLNLYIARRPSTSIVGPTGNGKTTMAEMALRAQAFDYEMISCTDQTTVTDLVGGLILRASGEEWIDGIITRCFRAGKGIILDEADALDPRVGLAMQNALQDPGPDGRGRYVSLPTGERVYPTGKCPIVQTWNTFGTGATRQYVGRNKLDAASVDRTSILFTRYENEDSILTGRGVSADLTHRLVTWAQAVRAKIDAAGLPISLSPRTLLRIAEGVQDFDWTLPMACEFEFYERISPDQVGEIRVDPVSTERGTASDIHSSFSWKK
jgi:hypothetical protein